tara:strand:+ start:96 stop:401 length:306 start_codon:yes stop_codon:yes gene_type:complete
MCTYISSFSAKGVKMEWIKTKDKLPKIGEKVFYYFEYVGVHFGRFTGFYTDEETGEYYPDMHVFTDMEGGWLTGDVTHWMPYNGQTEVPERPEEPKKRTYH